MGGSERCILKILTNIETFAVKFWSHLWRSKQLVRRIPRAEIGPRLRFYVLTSRLQIQQTPRLQFIDDDFEADLSCGFLEPKKSMYGQNEQTFKNSAIFYLESEHITMYCSKMNISICPKEKGFW